MLGQKLVLRYQKAMLYERWRKVAQERANDLALCELASGRQWSFAELACDAENFSVRPGAIVHPQGHTAEFVLTVLRAWQSHSIVCPLEPDQPAPAFPIPPAPCRHLKITSATTGPARAVAFTGEQLAADADNIVATMGLRPDWPNLGVISMAHSYGFSNLVLPLLLHGIPLALVPAPLPEMVRAAAEDYPAITLAGVPAMWRAWHEARAIPRNVRLAISAGAPLSLALERAVFEAGGLKIHNFYGSTECGGIAYDASNAPRADEACVGSPMQNVELKCNADGCLRILSRAAGQSYWPHPDEALGGGSFQTSDLAEFRDGLVYLRGRLNDLINVAGRKVAPDGIERALLKHPAVAACLVFGTPGLDAERAETIVACVVARTPATAAQLKQFLLDQLPAWQVPREWRFVDSLNTSSRGKISRAEWRRMFVSQR
jgi:acyl-CoA synthetase (AMP-forming)/AMP-acid ligase II